ncbi:uncharacterized protein LOC123564574 isoform X2 [Mercenaria mercenaria]|uniref:uncharacterized protein LOC123564574 isoform X2 n=1 Tax=Mercenaria mercenaria TaxID=6596 RepID=UPI00234E6120|nr:uncharacterized protein LOC123564574 isoform X2 [Mercenaria mercenaria]
MSSKSQKDGDVNGIEMQVIPQTQFIPLPEALCLIIMDLNNSQIVATLDTVCERLKFGYQGLHLPSNQHVYDTLGQLIRERKVFHTGCGYFVVTPDTFRMHGDDMQSPTLLSPWTHLHPMYIPAAFNQPPRQPMRSISCQVDTEHSVTGHQGSCDKPDKDLNCNEKLQIDLPSPRVQRSMSVSVKRPRDRGRRDEASEVGSVRRSSSVKGRNEKSKSLSKEETKSEGKQEKTKEKVSFFSKIFGRNKKKQQPPPEPKKPTVEYATFSAQFPPPEWMWYQQQLDRQLRTETWVQQQMHKSGTWHHYLHSMPGNSPTTSLHMGANSVPEKTSAMHNTHFNQNYHQVFRNSVPRKSNKKSHKHKDRLPIVIANNPGESTHLDLDQKHTYKNSMGQTNIRLSSLPTRLSPSGETLHSDYVSHPMFSSTPRFSSIPEHTKVTRETATHMDSEHKDVQPKSEKERSRSLRKSHKTKKKSHHDRHSSYLPTTRHVSGMSARTAAEMDNDISYEFQGHLPNKHSAIGKSHSSGVNCIGLEPEPSRNKSQKYQRSNSYRHTVTETQIDPSQVRRYQRSQSYRHPVKDHETVSKTEVSSHIYANVHISEETKPKVPERINRKSQCQSSLGHSRAETARDNSDFLCDRSTHYRLDLPESDRHSDHGSELGHDEQTSSSGGGTLNSNSSQEPPSTDSAVEGTESSEHSLGTVIDTRRIANKHLERLTADVQEMSLGDSGFSSPRISENSSESKKGDSNFTKSHNGFMCNNLKTGQRLNNSMGRLDECPEDSFDRISSDRLYENVRLSQKEVLNNMKYLHKEINVSSQNLNNQVHVAESSTTQVEFDPKQSVAKKFNFEGDFHVVGVV